LFSAVYQPLAQDAILFNGRDDEGHFAKLLESVPRRELLNLSILKTIAVDRVACSAFFTKLALAMGHYVLGETFSRSSGANRMRVAMGATDLETAWIPHASVWPYNDENNLSLKSILADEISGAADKQVSPPLQGFARARVSMLFFGTSTLSEG
jgi:hypothetical protein